jgi:tRNA nucleotidyltransferase/poly(A) polymerase
VRNIDAEAFFKERLKVSLLDILFAPEIAGGFKRLYGRDVEDAIGEIFKEVISARRLVEKFSQRFGKMRSSAEAEITKIMSEYEQSVQSLAKISKDIPTIPKFENLKMYEAGKSYEKMQGFAEIIRKRIQSLAESELFHNVKEAGENARKFSELQRTIMKTEDVKSQLAEIKRVTSDRSRLTRLINRLQKVTSPEESVGRPPRFYSTELQKQVDSIFRRLEDSKKQAHEASRSAKKLGVKPENVEDLIEDIGSVIAILKTKREIREEEKAALTKIAGKAYAVVPINVLVADHTFARMVKQLSLALVSIHGHAS